MTVLIYLVVLSLPFLMPFIARYLEEAVQVKPAMQPNVKMPAPKIYVEGEIGEALQILELRPNPSEYEIKLAHRKMIARNHPDQGGSMYFASKINYARDVLLKNVSAA